MKKLLLLLLAVVLVAVPASGQTVPQPFVTAARPTAFQLLQASAAGTTWAPVTIGGDLAVGTSPGLFKVTQLQGKAVSATAPTDAQLWMYESGSSTWTPVTISGGDLITSTTPYGQITVANGSNGAVNFGTGAITFNASLGGGTLSPTISQAPLTTASGTGKALTVQAQSETGTGATVGGALNLSSGNGATLGNINFQSGAGAYTLTTMNGNTGAWTWGLTAAMSLGQTATTGTAANATVQAQSSTGAGAAGGSLVLGSGSGPGANGIVQFQSGGTNVGAVANYGGLIITPANTTGGRILSGYYGAGGAANTLSLIGMSPTYNMYLGSDINNSYGPAPTTLYYGSGALTGSFNHIFNAINSTSTLAQEMAIGLTGIQVSVPSIYAPPNSAASTAGQSLSIVGANNTGTGTTSTGGALNVTGGSSANGAGGAINIIGGAGDTTGGTLGNGGNVLVSGGGSTAGGGVGGNVTIQAGGDPGGNGPGSIVLGGAASTTALISVSAPMYGTAGAYYGMVNGYSTVPVGGSANVLVPTTLAVSHYLDLTGAITANINVVLPISAGTEWCVGNLTTGAFTIRLYNGTTSGSAPGTAVTLSTPGSTAALGAKCTRVFSDGTYLRLAE